MRIITTFNRAILIIFLMLVCAGNLTAQIPKPMANTYVNDYARVLKKSQVAELNKRIHQLEREKHIQLAVIIVNKVPSMYQIEEFSFLIARRWKVGENGRGLVYVAAIKQRKQRIEVSRDLEPVFTDEVNTDVLAQTKPFFRKKQYGSGLLSMVDGISAAAPDVVSPDSQASNAKNVAGIEPAMQAGADSQKYWWVLGGIALLIVVLARRQRPVWGSSRSRYSNFGGGISSNDSDSSDYGRWGSSRGGESPSSSGSKYSGKGTTSDW